MLARRHIERLQRGLTYPEFQASRDPEGPIEWGGTAVGAASCHSYSGGRCCVPVLQMEQCTSCCEVSQLTDISPKACTNLQELLGDMDTLMRALPPTAQVRLGSRRSAQQHSDGS